MYESLKDHENSMNRGNRDAGPSDRLAGHQAHRQQKQYVKAKQSRTRSQHASSVLNGHGMGRSFSLSKYGSGASLHEFEARKEGGRPLPRTIPNHPGSGRQFHHNGRENGYVSDTGLDRQRPNPAALFTIRKRTSSRGSGTSAQTRQGARYVSKRALL